MVLIFEKGSGEGSGEGGHNGKPEEERMTEGRSRLSRRQTRDAPHGRVWSRAPRPSPQLVAQLPNSTTSISLSAHGVSPDVIPARVKTLFGRLPRIILGPNPLSALRMLHTHVPAVRWRT